MLKEKNLIILNVTDTESENSSESTKLVTEIFKDLSSPILVTNARRLDKSKNHTPYSAYQI